MREYYLKNILFSLLIILGGFSCSTDDSTVDSSALAGALIASCTINLSNGSQVTCSEFRNISQLYADAILDACISESNPDFMSGILAECPNKSTAFGECETTNDEGNKTYVFRTGENISAENSESLCVNSPGVYTVYQ